MVLGFGPDLRPGGGLHLRCGGPLIKQLPEHQPPARPQADATPASSASTSSSTCRTSTTAPQLGLLLPELHQPPAGDLRADRHAGGPRQRLRRRSTPSAAPRRRSRPGLPFHEAVATGRRGRAAARRAARRQPDAPRTATAVRDHRRQHPAVRRATSPRRRRALGTNEYGKTAGYYDEFPQNIKLLGVSFNTQIQKTGTALQGEVAYRHGVPLQVDDVELLVCRTHALRVGRRAAAG